MSSVIDRMQEVSIKSVKVFNNEKKGKNANGNKARRTAAYWEQETARQRRKQGKTSFDTHRREEQPDAEDLLLEDIHFANFLGSKCEDGIPYNNVHINEPVNLIECDMYLKAESSKNVPEEAAPQEEEDNTYNFGYGSWAPQISREPNTKWHMNWHYEPETQSLTGYSTYKRGHDEEADEEQTTKRMRSESFEQEKINFAEMVAYMDEQKQDNFAAMFAYMNEQVKLAQQIATDELYPCDCDHHHFHF